MTKVHPSLIDGITLPGYLSGLFLSNSVSDANNRIDFASGVATSNDGTERINLSSILTKRLDTTWASGNDVGGRMSSAAKAANTWYHCFVILNPAGVFNT